MSLAAQYLQRMRVKSAIALYYTNADKIHYLTKNIYAVCKEASHKYI